MKKNLCEWENKIKDEPNINHLNIGGGRKGVGHADEHGRQHQHNSQVHCDHGFKEKVFEVVCSVSNDVQQYCGKEYCQEIS